MKKALELEAMAALNIAANMAATARTAPKTRGMDNIEVIVIDDIATRDKLCSSMKKISERDNRPSLCRDADSIASSPVIVVIGVRSKPAGLDCGFCGYKTCSELLKTPGICSYNSIDLGIAVDSAAGMAAQLHADNRIMYSVGRAAIELGLFSKEVRQALGIPLSITGKSPFFDRK
ncbi:MAG: ferredoxin [Candidatus Omnitrophica bacterium]|nr:ferredoxin [Candidatus Omnitrophota bacterium]